MAMTIFTRPRRAFRGDIRFLIGLALVAISITGVWILIGATDDVTPVLQANRTITQGEALVSSDFRVAEVGLGALADQYVSPGALTDGQIASRSVRKGELLPSSAAAPASDARTTTIVVESSTRVPKEVTAGTVIELWGAPPLDDGRSLDVPRILVADVVVRDVIESEGMLADAGTSVELVIDRADVPDVLAAVTGGFAISVVPLGARS